MTDSIAFGTQKEAKTGERIELSEIIPPPTMWVSPEQYVYMAKLAEQAERYKEMVKLMEKLVIGVTPAAELTVGSVLSCQSNKRKSRGRTTITLCLLRTTDLRLRTSFPMYAQEY